MPAVSLVLFKRHDVARTAALGGLRKAFGGAERVHEVQSVDEFLVTPERSTCQLLILVCPQMSDLELAFAQAGNLNFPIVALGDAMASSGLTIIQPEDWHDSLLAQVFQNAMQTHTILRENDRLRGDLMTFARRISHDLRTHLSGILATAELLKDILSEQSDEDAELTNPLFDCTQAVLKLIERTSQVARATAEDRPKEDVDMAQAVWVGRQTVEAAAVRSRVQIHEPEEWPTVQGVSTWLEIIWANLLQFAVQRSEVESSVELMWEKKIDVFEFSVRDHGSDLSGDQCAALLWPFDRLHQGHSTKQLNIPIARRLIELQHGSIGCEPVTGGGIRFFFTLPHESVNAETLA